MAEVNSDEQQSRCALQTKRKPDLCSEGDPIKKPKVESSDANASYADDLEKNPRVEISGNGASPAKDRSSEDDPKKKRKVEELDGGSSHKVDEAGLGSLWDEDNEEDDEEEYEDGEDEDEEEEEEEDELSNGKSAEVDRKGKGITRVDKGKGKIEAEEESGDDDDDDSSDGTSQQDDDSVDDPLDEVDPNNILPSRTRRRVPRPGFYIANNPGGNGDDSDDSDA